MIKNIQKCFNYLKGLWLKIWRKKIPFDIHKEELIIRCIGHSFYYSKSDKKLKREAFLPPPDEDEVSVLRHKYTNDNFCKCHCMKIQFSNFQYCGLATFKAEIVFVLNVAHSFNITLKGTPLDKDNKYISSPPVYTSTIGVPMHGGIIFPTKTQRGQPNTEYRKFANLMIKEVKYISDPFPQQEKWQGEKLKPTL